MLYFQILHNLGGRVFCGLKSIAGGIIPVLFSFSSHLTRYSCCTLCIRTTDFNHGSRSPEKAIPRYRHTGGNNFDGLTTEPKFPAQQDLTVIWARQPCLHYMPHAACRLPPAARERSGIEMMVYNVAYATPRHTPSRLAGLREQHAVYTT